MYLNLSLVCLVFFVQAQTIDEVRSEFHQSVMEPDYSKEFHAHLVKIENPTPVIRAYKAVSEALLAQVVWNPMTKLSQVIKYDRKMKEAVSLDSDNIEIRFLRLAIEYNLPSFLGRSTQIQEDLEVIIQNLESVKSILDAMMAGNLCRCGAYDHYLNAVMRAAQSA